MSIQVSQVSKFYNTQKALDGVSFTVNPGEIVGFIGPNGAGKSTMMKILTGYLPPSEGSATVCGFDVVSQSIQARACIGYLPEHNPLYTQMYVREFLQFVAGVHKLGKNAQSRIDELIELTGLQRECHKKIGQLSKGYRQRVGLAQTLLHDPAVLILDEPTTGLDPNQIIEIRNVISQVGKSKAVMLSTHIMQEVEAICDRIIIINKGQLVANDNTENISTLSQLSRNTVIVEFDAEVSLDSLQMLLPQQKVVTANARTFVIETTDDTDVRKTIFRFAVDQGITVLSMQKKEKTLEEVFRELTVN